MSDEKKGQTAPVATPSSTASPSANEQMVAMFATAIASAMKSAQPTAGMLTGMSEERLERVQGKHERPLKYRVIRGHSDLTESTFDMIVLQDRRFPHGRVSRIVNYAHSPKVYKHQSQGGFMPDGQHIWQDNKHQGELSDATPGHMLSVWFKQSRWENYWQRDLAKFSTGLPLRVEYCVDGAKALDTPWIDSELPEAGTSARDAAE
jgi:hypothetical protein